MQVHPRRVMAPRRERAYVAALLERCRRRSGGPEVGGWGRHIGSRPAPTHCAHREELHGVAFAAALAVGVLLVVFSRESRVLPASVFAASAAVMLGTSTLYHRITWSPGCRASRT
jgi:Haemolysin-III related